MLYKIKGKLETEQKLYCIGILYMYYVGYLQVFKQFDAIFVLILSDCCSVFFLTSTAKVKYESVKK